MSYSRWGSSCWYSYWLTTDSKVRNEQRFDIGGFTTISYQDVLDNGIDGVIEILKDRLVKRNEELKAKPDTISFCAESYTDAEWEELKIYINEWVTDVKSEFDTPSQKYRDGEMTLEDAFVEEI